MSMSNYACFEDCISEKFVKGICSDEYAALINAINNSGNDLEYHADLLSYGDCEDEPTIEAFDILCRAFDKITGLELGICYHSAEDKADDLDGYAFTVAKVYVLSKAGEAHKQYIERKFWTIFG